MITCPAVTPAGRLRGGRESNQSPHCRRAGQRRHSSMASAMVSGSSASQCGARPVHSARAWGRRRRSDPAELTPVKYWRYGRGCRQTRRWNPSGSGQWEEMAGAVIDDNGGLLTSAEVARMWYVSLRTVQRRIAAGKLPAIRAARRALPHPPRGRQRGLRRNRLLAPSPLGFFAWPPRHTVDGAHRHLYQMRHPSRLRPRSGHLTFRRPS